MPEYQFGAAQAPHQRWPVAWYNPAVLLQSARELVSSSDVIRNADPRELWTGVFEATDHTGETGSDGTLWFDFLSDTGDGGNATYTVARAVQADTMDAGAGQQCPRGQILFLGGDLSYPGASAYEYQYRFLEMFEGARTTSGPDTQHRSTYAVAQNHDWFDSLSTFKRYFVDRDQGEVFGVRTPQKRSYFATRLPHGWWVLGFDFALAGDLDRGQYEAFRRLAGDTIPGAPNPEHAMAPGDQLILIYPEPYWTRPLGDGAPEGYPKRYQRLEALLESKGLRIRMRIAGDVHHYCREASANGDPAAADLLVTCGSGGAFLHPTHAKSLSQPKVHRVLRDPSAISPELGHATRVGSVSAESNGPGDYTAQCRYPEPDVSRALGNAIWWSLFKFAWNSLDPRGGHLGRGIAQGNLVFPLVLGLAYGSAYWFAYSGTVMLAVCLAMAAMCFGLAKDEPGKPARVGAPLVHAALQIGGMYGVSHALGGAAWFSAPAALSYTFSVAPLAGTLGSVALGAVVGGLLAGVYFWCMARCGLLWNNAFSPLACEDYKGFLRFRLDPDGNLTGFFFGCDAVPKRWALNPDGAGKAPGTARPVWVEPAGTPPARWHVVDRFTLRRSSGS
jgi:hypothetical protein